MPRYRKKPVEVDAIRNDGSAIRVTEWIASLPGIRGKEGHGFDFHFDGSIDVHTLEGTMRAEVGDWIICGVKGELYPCRPDIFEATYEDADAEQPEIVESKSTVSQIRKVLLAVEELGTSWRNSWADFDGRTLRAELEEATGLIGRALDGDDVEDEADALIEEFTFNR